VDAVLEKVVNAEAKNVVLTIPRFAKLGQSPEHFQVLRDRLEPLGKMLAVESVDETVMDHCDQAGVNCYNPFFVKSKRQFLDVVVKRSGAKTGKKSKEDSEEEFESFFSKRADQPKKKRISISFSLPVFSFGGGMGGMKKWLIGGAVAAIAVFGFYAAAKVLPKAEIILTTEKDDWSYRESVVADKDLTEINYDRAKIPGQLFTERKNLQLSFSASGKKNVERKATGLMTVYNAYSSEKQILVEKTRFLTPDGKIFRLTQKITVPGAKIENGKIVPSSIDVEVVADQAGESYNLGSVSYLSIPGLKGGPKYDGFYGELKSATTGGFIGEAAYPTDADMKSAKAALAKTLEEALQNSITSQIPAGLKVVDGSSVFSLIKQTVNTVTDAEGKFTVFGEAEVKKMAFRETDVLDLLRERMRLEFSAESDFKSFETQYGLAKLDVSNKFATVPITFRGIVFRGIDTTSLVDQVKGKSESELKILFSTFSGLEKVQINLKPFWVRTVPDRSDKVKIVVD